MLKQTSKYCGTKIIHDPLHSNSELNNIIPHIVFEMKAFKKGREHFGVLYNNY